MAVYTFLFHKVYILPTYLWPQIVGGLILGIGFIMGGYCPTTSVVATVSGKLDGLIFLVGMVVGSFVFGEIFPALEKFYSSGSMGQVTLPQVLGIQSGIIALAVVLMAVVAYWIVEKVEVKFGDPETLPQGGRRAKLVGAVVLIILGVGIAAVNPDKVVSAKKSTAKETTKIEQPVPPPAHTGTETGEGGAIIVEDEGC